MLGCAGRLAGGWAARVGVGVILAGCRIGQTVLSAVLWPRLISSPWIRRWPQAGFSCASLKISSRISCRVWGRLGRW
jgi:hypothetical protein